MEDETKKKKSQQDELVNPLTNERVIVRHINRQRGSITDPRHVLYGGMSERAVRIFVVPKLTSGVYVNVLTKNEKAFLEQAMGLEYNALSIHKKENNFWDDSNPNGINRVRLTKQDTYLDLSNPEDYIKYKILLANKDFIAPSLQAMQDMPRASYQFVLIREGEEAKQTKQALSIMAQCYKEFGKVENDASVLRLVVETLENKPLAAATKLEFLQAKIYDLIQADSKTFLKVITDPMLSTKVLIRTAIDAGEIIKRGNYHYLKADNTPLCESGEEPTFSVAAKFLNNPRHQETKFALEAKLK